MWSRIWIDKNKFTGMYRCRVRDYETHKNIHIGTFKTSQECYTKAIEYLKERGDYDCKE